MPEGSNLIFGDTQIYFKYGAVWNMWKEGSMPKTARFVQSFRYSTDCEDWTDRRTDDDRIYRERRAVNVF